MPVLDRTDWLVLQSIVEYSFKALEEANDPGVGELRDRWLAVLEHVKARSSDVAEGRDIDHLLDFFEYRRIRHGEE